MIVRDDEEVIDCLREKLSTVNYLKEKGEQP